MTNTDCDPIGCSVFQSTFALLCIACGFNLISNLPNHVVSYPSTARFRGRNFCYVSNIAAKQGGGERLPKFIFSAKFPIGLHVILQIQIKKFENDCYIMWKIILTEIRRGSTLNPSWNNVKWILFVNYTVIRMLYMKWSRSYIDIIGVATLNLALPAPLQLQQNIALCRPQRCTNVSVFSSGI